MASEERVRIENIFSLPGLEVHLNASKAIPKLSEDIKKLEALPPGDKRRKAFTDFFKVLSERLSVKVPDFALEDTIVNSCKQIGGTTATYIYWRNVMGGTQFLVAVDLHNDRIGFWDTQKTGKFLLIQQ